ncbi:acetylxylan esterase [Olivibacter sp. CPCC 100613]|uniref:dienelactone hydrolase family protein n=1 Tax=Olivibacter sp. CPCC 100613 TaxID=3079931 RepID=UPI002FFC7A12
MQAEIPSVFKKSDRKPDFISQHYRDLAAHASKDCIQSSRNEEWGSLATKLKQKLIKQTKLSFFNALDFDLKETAEIEQPRFKIKNIAFQTRPSVYATGNLYLPKIAGPLPAILLSHGHWEGARNAYLFRQAAQHFAKAGYVVLTMDAWGAGERCSEVNREEYHGGNLGAALFNIGETLMGMQLTDNVRALDFLCSLPSVDPERIGVTGASGGGNQAMWLAALDERVKAAVPVVSVGTFESYVMNSNCVCELLPNGLTFSEESLVLGLVAPRALKILSALGEDNSAFYPKEMLRSYEYAQELYNKTGAADKLAYELFEQEHTYSIEMLRVAIKWFDLHLENTSTSERLKGLETEALLDQELLRTYRKGRPALVETTGHFCLHRGVLLRSKSLAENVPCLTKLNELAKLIGQVEQKTLKQVTGKKDNEWQKIVLTCSTGQEIPLLLYEPKERITCCKVVFHGDGKGATPVKLMKDAQEEGHVLVLVDLWGLGEQASVEASKNDEGLPKFHTLSRSALWLGRTVLAEWLSDMELIYHWLIKRGMQAITFIGYREPSVATLIFSTRHELKDLVLHDAPYSYVFDDRTGLDYYNMSIHIPGVLCWGDLTMIAVLSKATTIQFVHARSMSGRKLDQKGVNELQEEIALMKQKWNKSNKIKFIID